MLWSNGWLSGHPEPFRDLVLGRCRIVTFSKNQTIYSLGDPVGGPYGLIRGAIRVELLVSEAGSHVAHVATPGFWVGEGAALRRKPRAVSVTAARESVLAYLPLAQFDQLAGDADFIRRYAELSAENTVLALRVIRDLLIPGIHARVASKLLTLASMQRPSGSDDLFARAMHVTQADLAMMCGISRKSLNHHLSILRAEGVIRTGYGGLEILDRSKLASISEKRDETG